MRILTVISTRPEIIRLSLVIKKLDDIYGDNHIVVYTNQNYDKNLSTIFFKELNIRNPNYILKNKFNSIGEQLSNMISELEKVFIKERPDKILILGDTNGCLATSIIADKLNIPVYHIEAGNRCFNKRSPEEKNRKVIDHSAYINMCYTNNSKQNLLNEGLPINRMFVIGNPIIDILEANKFNFKTDEIYTYLKNNINKNFNNQYFLVTLHRGENVDNVDKLMNIISALNIISKRFDKFIIVSTHPRTKEKLKNAGINTKIYNDKIFFCEPFSFYEFCSLEKQAEMILTDSGTVQEESSYFKKPCVVLRDYNERYETIEFGNTIQGGTTTNGIINSVEVLLKNKDTKYPDKIYQNENINNTTDKIINILSSNYEF